MPSQGLAVRLDSSATCTGVLGSAGGRGDTIRVTCTTPSGVDAGPLLAHARDERSEVRRRRAAAAAEHARAARRPARGELGESLRRDVLAASEAELVFGRAEVGIDPERQ